MEETLPEENLKDLAEHAMDDKRADGNAEERTRELYDVPSVSPEGLADPKDNRNENEQ
jgi:hypothetical protein